MARLRTIRKLLTWARVSPEPVGDDRKGTAMSLAMIVAIIKPHKLEEVKEALLANGVEGMTITEVRGFGRQRGKTENFRGSEYTIDFVPKLKVEVIVPDTDVDKIVSVVSEAAKTGKIGDGKVWSVGVDRLLRVRTGETGTDAI